MQNLKLMFNLLSSALFNKELNEYWKNNSYDINYVKSIYNLLKRHDLSHIIAYKLISLKIDKNSDLYKEFLTNILITDTKYKNMLKEKNKIADILEKNKFNHIFLKGFSVIRDLYPEPWMRTCGDIDLLVKKEDISKIDNLFKTKLNYKINEKEKIVRHHIAYVSQEGIDVELHFKLNSQLDNHIESALCDIWQNVQPVNNTRYQFQLSPEYTYFFHIIHMEKHFKLFNCSIKMFIDLHFLNNNSKNLDKTKIQQLLKKARILTFANAANDLSNVWFDNRKHNDITSKMEKYCINIDTKQDTRRKKIIILERAKYGGKFKFIFRRMFLTYKEMIVLYPSLQSRKFLLPFYYIHRALYYLSKGHLKVFIKDLKKNKNSYQEETQEITQLFKKLNMINKN